MFVHGGPDRRCRIWRRSIEAQRLRLSWEQTGVKDAIEHAISSHQLRSAFWPNPGSAGQLVGRITPERDEMRYLFWIGPISLRDLIRADARNFAAPQR
jgi:hypothetical protein